MAGNYLDTLPKHRDDYRLHHLRRDVRTLRAGRFDRNGHRSLVLETTERQRGINTRHSRRRTALVPSFFIRDQLFYRKTINIICFSKINTNFALSKLKNEQACRTKKDCTGIYC